jgi:hypothetical protein
MKKDKDDDDWSIELANDMQNSLMIGALLGGLGQRRQVIANIKINISMFIKLLIFRILYLMMN